jgi:hypothetical protein
MKLGQQMIRQDDGQKGLVAQQAGELRIVYLDRGESRVAGKGEKWVPDELPEGPMRVEEMVLVALYADRALRAIERHEPHRTWETPTPRDETYDRGLVRVIVDYLSDRHGPPGPR